MEKKHWPGFTSGLVNGFLFLVVPAVMRHTRFKQYITTYMFTMLAIEALLLIAVVIVRRNRRKALR